MGAVSITPTTGHVPTTVVSAVTLPVTEIISYEGIVSWVEWMFRLVGNRDIVEGLVKRNLSQFLDEFLQLESTQSLIALAKLPAFLERLFQIYPQNCQLLIDYILMSRLLGVDLRLENIGMDEQGRLLIVKIEEALVDSLVLNLGLLGKLTAGTDKYLSSIKFPMFVASDVTEDFLWPQHSVSPQTLMWEIVDKIIAPAGSEVQITAEEVREILRHSWQVKQPVIFKAVLRQFLLPGFIAQASLAHFLRCRTEYVVHAVVWPFFQDNCKMLRRMFSSDGTGRDWFNAHFTQHCVQGGDTLADQIFHEVKGFISADRVLFTEHKKIKVEFGAELSRLQGRKPLVRRAMVDIQPQPEQLQIEKAIESQVYIKIFCNSVLVEVQEQYECLVNVENQLIRLLGRVALLATIASNVENQVSAFQYWNVEQGRGFLDVRFLCDFYVRHCNRWLEKIRSLLTTHAQIEQVVKSAVANVQRLQHLIEEKIRQVQFLYGHASVEIRVLHDLQTEITDYFHEKIEKTIEAIQEKTQPACVTVPLNLFCAKLTTSSEQLQVMSQQAVASEIDASAMLSRLLLEYADHESLFLLEVKNGIDSKLDAKRKFLSAIRVELDAHKVVASDLVGARTFLINIIRACVVVMHVPKPSGLVGVASWWRKDANAASWERLLAVLKKTAITYNAPYVEQILKEAVAMSSTELYASLPENFKQRITGQLIPGNILPMQLAPSAQECVTAL